MERVVVGVDGSPHSVVALRWAVDEASRRGATVEAVNAFHLPYAGGGVVMPLALDPGPFREAAEESLAKAVAEVDTSALSEPPVELVVEGPAASVLVEAGRGSAMVVVGSRGHGGLTGMLLGSVSRAVTEHATVPVVVVPAHGEVS